MFTNHIKITSGQKSLILADFWVQSEAPLGRLECRHIVESMGFDLTAVKWALTESYQLESADSEAYTIVEAVLPLPSYKVTQLPNGEKNWEKEYWSEYQVINLDLSESAAYNIAVEWALESGFEESDIIGSIKVTRRRVTKQAV